MKKLYYSAAAPLLFALPFLVNAQLADQNPTGEGGTGNEGVGNFLINILEFTNSVLIPFIIGIGFLVFVWGMFYYFILGGANDEKKEQGRSLMIYAVLAFVLIVVFWGVINLIAGSLFDDNQTQGLDNLPAVFDDDRTGTNPPPAI